MARDIFHENVKKALQKEGWKVTHDPLTFKVGTVQIQIDLGAERVIAAERDTEKIAVEIKTFGNASFITALYEAFGKYIVYRNILALLKSDRTLYLAVPENIYNRNFSQKAIQYTMKAERFKLVIYNQSIETITKWIIN